MCCKLLAESLAGLFRLVLLCLLHLHRAELELWDFSVRVKGIDGEQVGRRLAEVEGDEYAPLVRA